MAKKISSAWTPECLPPEFSHTRDAAAACLYAEHFYKDQYTALLTATLRECYPQANLDKTFDIILHRAEFENISDTLIDELIATTHTESYEILPWREASLKILALDFMANLKSPSAQLSEDAINRVVNTLDEKLRGTTKNATQLLAGQRTRMRKTIHALAMAALYLYHYRPTLSFSSIQEQLAILVQSSNEDDFIVDEFPFTGFFAENQTSLNARGNFVLKSAINIARTIQPYFEKLDDIIQKSSKKWRVSRMTVIDLNILRIATYEIFYEKTTSPKTIINEAVELAKKYSADQSKNFVNGILQQICTDNQIST